jgi:hypothetical protein
MKTITDKRVGRLEEKPGHRRGPGIHVVTSTGGAAAVLPAGCVLDLPGGGKLRLPTSVVAGECICLMQQFYWEGEQAPDLPDPTEEIARQRAEGKKLILVQVPWKIEEET